VNRSELEQLQIAYDDAQRTPHGSWLRPGTHFVLIGVLNMVGYPVHSYNAAIKQARQLLGVKRIEDSVYDELKGASMKPRP